MQLLSFDARRGNKEGLEADKVLGFHPSQTAADQQCGLAGILQGLLLFSSNFSQDARWDLVETDKSTWVVLEAEPSIWFALTAPKSWVPRHGTADGLRAVMVQLHHAVTLLAGSVEQLLVRDPSGGLAREAIQPVLEFVAAQLASPASWHHRELRNPLMDAALTPTVVLPQPVPLAVQSYCNQVLEAAALGAEAPPVQDVILLYQRDLLWSSLQPGDTSRVYTVLAGSLLYPSAPVPASGRPMPSILESAAWQHRPDGLIVLKSGDGDAAGDLLPAVHLGGQRQSRMLPMLDGKLLTVLLLAPGAAPEASSLGALRDAVQLPARRLAAQIADAVKSSGVEPSHLPGYRYLLRSNEMQAVQATPRVKISAMTHHSRSLASTLRDSLAWRQPQQEDSPAGVQPDGGVDDADGCRQSAAREVLVKSSQGFWALLQRRGSQQLLAVRERRNERSSAEASASLAACADLLASRSSPL